MEQKDRTNVSFASALSTLLEVVYLLGSVFFLYLSSLFFWEAYTEIGPGAGVVAGLSLVIIIPWALISIVVAPLPIWRNLKRIRAPAAEGSRVSWAIARLIVYIPTLCASLYFVHMVFRDF